MLNGKILEKTCSILSDSNLQNDINIIETPWVKCTLTIWKTVTKEYKLEGDIIVNKWCAYDSDFMPNKLDTTFKDWALKGLYAGL